MATTKEFVTYSPNTGNKNASISVTAKENTSSSTRSMKLNTSKNGINKEVNIMQKAKISSDTVLLTSSTSNEKYKLILLLELLSLVVQLEYIVYLIMPQQFWVLMLLLTKLRG